MRAARCGPGGRVGVTAAASLDAGLLVRTEHELVRPEWLALPAAGIQVEHRAGPFQKVRIAWKDPATDAARAAARPGSTSARCCCAKDRFRVPSTVGGFSGEFTQAVAAERHVTFGWSFTGRATTRARVVAGSTVGRPRRGRSWSPSQPAARKRARQRWTVVRLIRSCCASRREPSPAALPRMTALGGPAAVASSPRAPRSSGIVLGGGQGNQRSRSDHVATSVSPPSTRLGWSDRKPPAADCAMPSAIGTLARCRLPAADRTSRGCRRLCQTCRSCSRSATRHAA